VRCDTCHCLFVCLSVCHTRVIKSTLLSLKCLSVCTYVRLSVCPQIVFLISSKICMYIEVDEWCTTVFSMTRSKVKVKVESPWKLEILSFSKAISSAIYSGSWQLTTDVFVSRDLEVGRNVSCEESTVSAVRGWFIICDCWCCIFCERF